MNNLEFRAYDEINKEWLQIKSGGKSLNYKTDKLEYTYSTTFSILEWETLRKIGAFPGNYKITQYTGIKDINGTKIFAGDIFKDDEWWVGRAVVEFENGMYGFWTDGKEEFIPLHDCKKIEIIGNKYQKNKELLTI